MNPLNRHPTSSTLVLFAALCVGLSWAPLPSWLKPLELPSDEPVLALWNKLTTKPRSVPRPSQGYVAGGGALDAAEEDRFFDPDSDGEESLAEVPIRGPAAEPIPVRAWSPPERPRFDRYAQRLSLKAAPLRNPCVLPRAEGCGRTALQRFFEALRRAESGQRGAVRVVHFGDSLIASDKITDRVRLRLQQRFGSAGPGFLFVRKFNRFQRGHRTGKGSGGWVMDVITQGVIQDKYFGYTGASFEAQAAGETVRFERIAGVGRAEVFYLAEPGGGILAFQADGREIARVDTRSYSGTEAARHVFEVPEGTQLLVMEAVTHGPRVFGLALEAREPSGVVVESIGLPGATSEVWLIPEEEGFARQLAARDPALVVAMLGGNDVLMLSKRRTDPDEVESAMRQFLGRVKAAVPSADCLIVSPLESVYAKNDGRLIPKPAVQTVIELQEKVARDAGCAFWDMHASMGGVGSLERWVEADLMLGDLIHPRSRGSDLLGEMFSDALMAAYDDQFRKGTH